MLSSRIYTRKIARAAVAALSATGVTVPAYAVNESPYDALEDQAPREMKEEHAEQRAAA
jgi:hypothetical protein